MIDIPPEEERESRWLEALFLHDTDELRYDSTRSVDTTYHPASPTRSEVRNTIRVKDIQRLMRECDSSVIHPDDYWTDDAPTNERLIQAMVSMGNRDAPDVDTVPLLSLRAPENDAPRAVVAGMMLQNVPGVRETAQLRSSGVGPLCREYLSNDAVSAANLTDVTGPDGRDAFGVLWRKVGRDQQTRSFAEEGDE